MSDPVTDGVNTTATLLSSLAGNFSKDAANLVLGGDGIVGIGVALLCFFLAMIVTWLILRLYLVAYGAAVRKANPTSKAAKASDGPGQVMLGEGFFFSRLDELGIALTSAAVAFLTGALAALKDALANLLADWMYLLGLLIVAVVAGVFLVTHEVIFEVIETVNQCTVRPLLDFVIFPILNLLRMFFAFAWPAVNAYADLMSALTYGNLYVTYKCTPTSLFQEVVTQILVGLQTLAEALIAFLLDGLLTDGRWDMIPGLEELAEAINMTRVVGDCYCLDGAPFWDFFYGSLTSVNLLTTIDCYTNYGIRFWQIPIDFVFNGQFPNTTNLANEFVCADFAFGDWAEDVVRLALEMVQGFYDLINGLLSMTMSSADRTFMFARMAAIHTVAQHTLDLPPVLLDLTATPGAVPMRGLAMAMMTSVDNAIRVHQGASHKLFAFENMAGVDPILSSSTLHWTPPMSGLPIALALGLDALLRVANTDWSKLVTAPIAVGAGILNLTINAAFHPVLAFTSSSGIAFFQYGLLGDWTRMWFNAVAELLAFFDIALPCTFSMPLQAIGSLGEAFWEWLTAGIYSWAFPPWQPGVPPPFNCSVINCSVPAPADWTFLDFWAAWYSWNGSRLRQNLYLLLEGGECTAYLLGCNTSALNNNLTNVSNCTEAPLGCTARALNKVVVSLLNLTFSTFFYLPYTLRFNASYLTFANLPTNDTELALEEFLVCFGLLLDELDPTGEQCLTGTEPPTRPDNPYIFVPPDLSVGVVDVPPRTEWFCDLDGQARYWDNRDVVVLNTTNIFNFDGLQYPCLINETRGCALAVSTSVEVIGSAPEDNVTLLFSPTWAVSAGADALVLIYNATTGTLLIPLPNASTLLSDYNVTSITTTNCTPPTPLPPMLGPEWACWGANSTGMYITPYGQSTTQYLANFSFYQQPPNSGIAFPMPCTTTIEPIVFCKPGDNTIWINAPEGLRQVVVQQLLPGIQAIDIALNCTDNTTAGLFASNNLVCRYNALAVVSTIGTFVPSNVSLLWPVYYYVDADNASLETQFVQCTNDNPTDYACPSAEMLWDSPQTEIQTFNGGNLVNLVCQPNPILVPSICTMVNVTYIGNQNVTVIMEGGEVFVYTNGVFDPVPCLYQSIVFNSTGSISASGYDLQQATTATNQALQTEAEQQPLVGAAAGVNLKRLVLHAQAVSLAQYLKRDAGINTPVATRSALNFMLRYQGKLMAQSMPARLGQMQRLLFLAADYHISAVFRKESFVCCISAALVALGQFIVSFVFAIVYLIQGVLTLPAIPNTRVPLPTFAVARDNLRTALCRLACVLANGIPFTVSCPNVGIGGNGTVCSNLTSCGKNWLCDLFDLPILIADFIVDTLTLANALITDPANITPDEKLILGPDCSYNDAGACLVSFLVYFVTHTSQAFTMAFRTFAVVLDCFLCAIVRGTAPVTTCSSPFFSVVNAIMNAVDAVVNSTVLTLVLNFIVGVVQSFVYLFTGQWTALWDTISTKVFGNLLAIFRNLGTIIIEFLKRIPYVGKIVSVLLNLIQKSCGVLNKVITLFNGKSIGCPSGLKRNVLDAPILGWVTSSANVSDVWQEGGEAADSCGARMALLNATDLAAVEDNQTVHHELMYCYVAHLWVGPTATPEADPETQAHPTYCDLVMPMLYQRGYTWEGMEFQTQARALACVQARIDAEDARADQNYTGTWVPHDLFYADNWRGLFQLGDELRVSFSVYDQYKEDQSTPAPVLVSTEYQDGWASQGYSTDHLVALASTATTVGDVHQALDAAQGNLSLDAYATRMTTASTSRKRQIGGGGLPTWHEEKSYDTPRIAGLAKFLWQPLMNGTGHPDGQSLMSFVAQSTFDQIEQRHDTVLTSIPLSRNIMPRLFAGDDPRLLKQTMGSMVDVFFKDLPAVAITLARTPARMVETMKRSWPSNAPAVGSYFYMAMQGAFKLTKEFFTGTVNTTLQWFENNQTRDWLAQEAMRGHLRHPGLQTAGAWQNQSLIGSAMSAVGKIFSLVAFPRSTSSGRWSSLLDLAENGQAKQQSMSSAEMRLVKINRLAARIALMSSVRGDTTAYRERLQKAAYQPMWARMSQVTNQSANLTCLFFVVNGTNISYPLCDVCLGLDQIFGRFERGINNAMAFYSANNASYPSLNYSNTAYRFAHTYLLDQDATVVVGYSSTGPLPIRWPSPNHTWIEWWQDPTPNKTGVTDLGALLNNTWQFFKGFLNPANIPPFTLFGSTLKRDEQGGRMRHPLPLTLRLRQRAEHWANATKNPHLLGPITGTAMQLMDAFWKVSLQASGHSKSSDAVEAGLGLMVHSQATSPLEVGPFTSWQQLLEAWYNFFLSLILCPWNDLAVNAKRFSLGYVFIYGIIATIVLTAVLQVLTGGSLFFVGLLSAGMVATTVLLFWILITYSYGLLCPVALPLGVADDAAYFLFFSLLPKCGLWQSGTARWIMLHIKQQT